MSVVDQFLGKWKLCESEKFDEYLQELGIGWLLRKTASTTTPTLEWTKKGDGHYNMKTITTLKTTDLEFTLGVPFEETRLDGEKCQSVLKEDGGKLLHTMTDKNGKSTTVTREVLGDKLVATCVAGSVTALRKYARH